jgi:replicative DNA helicase
VAKRSKPSIPDLEVDLPWDQESEVNCLASILVNSTQLSLVRETITSEDFFLESHQVLYDAIFHLWTQEKKCDPTLLAAHLRQKGTFKKAGGVDGLGRVVESIIPGGSHGLYHAEKVREWSIERKMQSSLYEALRASQRREASVQDRLAQTISDLYAAQSRKMTTEVAPASLLVRRFEERLSETNEQRARRISATGFADLDTLLGGGFRKGQLIVIAARPGVGKTSLALNIAHHVSKAGPRAVLYSLEMHADEICDRLTSSISGVESRKLRSGNLGDSREKVMEACREIDKLPVYIITGGGFSPESISLQLRAMIATSDVPIGMILIDYLQLVTPSPTQLKRREGRERDVASMSREFKRLSLDLDIPVVCACQLNRGASDEKPRLHHLRESGAIEQDADVVIFIHRNENRKDEHDEYELMVVKQRNGPVGSFPIHWDKNTTTFRNGIHQPKPDWGANVTF